MSFTILDTIDEHIQALGSLHCWYAYLMPFHG